MAVPGPAADSFLRDLLAAVRVWREAWWLPVISVLLGASVWANGAQRLLQGATGEEGQATSGDAGFALLLLVVSVVELGWFGTEREVHRRVWSGESDPANGLLGVTVRYAGRFLLLGLLVGWPIVLAPLLLTESLAAASAFTYLVTLAVYVVITFVTPELAFRTRTASGAVVRGLATLTQQFPHVRWHVLLPAPLVVTFGMAAGSTGIPELARLVLGAVGTLVGLATKGAIARRWLVLHTEQFAAIERAETGVS